MNTFFRIAIYMCLGLIVFNFIIGFVHATGAFQYTSDIGEDLNNTGSLIGDITSYSDISSMGDLLTMIGIGTLIGVGITIATRSMIPLGISIFSSVFWASFINTHAILGVQLTGGVSLIPGELLTIFTVCAVLIFIAAIIGMLTGSG